MADDIRDTLSEWRLDSKGKGVRHQLSRAPQRVRALADCVEQALDEIDEDEHQELIASIQDRLDDPDCH